MAAIRAGKEMLIGLLMLHVHCIMHAYLSSYTIPMACRFPLPRYISDREVYSCALIGVNENIYRLQA